MLLKPSGEISNHKGIYENNEALFFCSVFSSIFYGSGFGVIRTLDNRTVTHVCAGFWRRASSIVIRHFKRFELRNKPQIFLNDFD